MWHTPVVPPLSSSPPNPQRPPSSGGGCPAKYLASSIIPSAQPSPPASQLPGHLRSRRLLWKRQWTRPRPQSPPSDTCPWYCRVGMTGGSAPVTPVRLRQAVPPAAQRSPVEAGCGVE
ncbi:hypothetical protein K470DRAFT_81437 [Piedraia hortae CBS 480.64]|uniref:Uncharacterized protein n=1 Tax=Piedraia hortae CBS 480.64 TaxID=1314780 RepID=A0A6A7C896_9PEZI|nr:hypothetical protein K470DRAFT_81437 [Piedraia hortae CBS 480.64]